MLIAFVILTGASMAACAHEPRVDILAPDGSERAAVRVEIASTEPARELGLMYRNHLDEDAGMIFVFDHPQHLTFWMKNTEIPLDMIFAARSGQIVGIVANAAPFTEDLRAVDGNSLYVLEVNGGFCQRHRITAGDRLRFAGFTPTATE